MHIDYTFKKNTRKIIFCKLIDLDNNYSFLIIFITFSAFFSSSRLVTMMLYFLNQDTFNDEKSFHNIFHYFINLLFILN